MGDENKAENVVLQSGEDDPARGQEEREFGAGRQEPQSTGAREDRDANRDGKLGSAGADTSSRAPLGRTPLPPD